MRAKSVVLWPVLIAGTVSLAAEPVDLDIVTRIRQEGFSRSQVMKTARQLTDVIGPRLTGSPQMKRANEWTRQQLEDWGLSNARLEGFEFGRGWSYTRSRVTMLEPLEIPLIALPKAWSPGTRKAVRGTVMRVKLESEKDFDKYRGKLEGKVLLLDKPAEIEPEEEPFRRYSDEQLTELTEFPIREPRRGDFRKRRRKRYEFRKALHDFLVEEQALATIDVSSRDYGIIRLGGTGAYRVEDNPGVPALVMAVEHYNRILRFVDDEVEVKLEVDVRTRFHDEDTRAYNTLAEMEGTDLADEIVMLGAHMDSWHAGTGATDNAAGCAVAMEAVRILQALEARPRRTIRLALWSGEEQGLKGSRAYVEEHFAGRPESEDPKELELPPSLREVQWPLMLEPDHSKLSVYFNLDNGSGKIRGIYAEENAAVRPLFESWLEPFHDLGADTVTLRRTGGTDHTPFDRVGLPGFQFIQDGLEYRSGTHHSNMDVYDHLQAQDLMQASVVMASFVYHAAMRDEMLPREPLPQEPPQNPEEKRDPADREAED